MSNDASYYVVRTVNRLEFTLDVAEGDRLVTVLDVMRENVWADTREGGDAMFVHTTDRSGSDIRVRAAQIEAIYLSTPATRANDKRLCEEMKGDKNWSDDDA